MASGGDPREIEDPPASLRSQVWENFSFPVSYSSTGERASEEGHLSLMLSMVDKTSSVCRCCKAVVVYVSGNTPNMLTHLACAK